MEHRLGQRQPPFGQADEVDRLLRRDTDLERLRISHDTKMPFPTYRYAI
jgi:hypothetical protein